MPVSVSVAPLHKADDDGVALTEAGTELTTIDDVVTVPLPQPLVATRV